ncbi:D-amino acid dehydrogenase small subunit [Roseivivax sp. THAF40]|uniref:NAD(P)/FAD-dependent oxidoreductase n=1 Tax=unclassified Roseivivax TaxID=2639302 RepID=UPI0012678ADE|nr:MULTISPECIES: FAD-dependent oxidoreductase [unclassified Roseivivax]QFS81823.1 D-amino acid dehydrogenase small subunit [Roseivivax sp. THAF197b]QFT45623.1 D-amino acid dehydrogenase small subunit [Roseivivax sp. THAF40]
MTEGRGTHRVAVLGAGIVGVSTALWLQRFGAEVTLIDRAAPGAGASAGNAGVLAASALRPSLDAAALRAAPGMLLDRDAPLFLRWSYLPRLLPWLARALRHVGEAEVGRISDALAHLVTDAVEAHAATAEGTPATHFLQRSDYVYAYRDAAAYAAGAAGLAIKADAGFPHRRLSGAEVQDYDPALGPELGVIAVLGAHGFITDPEGYVTALAEGFEAEGGTFRQAEVQALRIEDGRVTGIVLPGETLPCDQAVVAMGAASAPLLKSVGISLPLETERGYHLQLHSIDGAPRQPVMVAEGQFVATPMARGARLAGILELGGLEAGPSRAPFGLLRRLGARAFPGLDFTEAQEWMGHRPALPDSLPLLGQVRETGLWGAVGHHHVGLTGGPKSGRLLAEQMMGRRPNVDLGPFGAARFARR